MSQPLDEKMTFIAKLDGIAAKMVSDLIEEKKKNIDRRGFGKSRATNVLLCELYQLRLKG